MVFVFIESFFFCVFSFFFFKQKTAYEMRISDWSSDVCSSDLKVGDRSSQQWLIGTTVKRRECSGQALIEFLSGCFEACDSWIVLCCIPIEFDSWVGIARMNF